MKEGYRTVEQVLGQVVELVKHSWQAKDTVIESDTEQ